MLRFNETAKDTQLAGGLETDSSFGEFHHRTWRSLPTEEV